MSVAATHNQVEAARRRRCRMFSACAEGVSQIVTRFLCVFVGVGRWHYMAEVPEV